MLHHEDREAIEKSKGRLQLNYNNHERGYTYKFGVAKTLTHVSQRGEAHLRRFGKVCVPEIFLVFTVFVEQPLLIEGLWKSHFGGSEWISKIDFEYALQECDR